MLGVGVICMRIFSWYFPYENDSPRTFQPRDGGDGKEPQEETKKVKRLALFFHGPTTPPHGFLTMMNACQQAGFAVQRYPEMPRFLPKGLHAWRLHGYLIGLVRRWQPRLEELVLVGHGEGGRLARAAVESGILTQVPEIKLVTIGTPHQSLFRDLPPRDERYLAVPFLNIVGGYDHIAPRSRAYHPQAHVEFFDLGHETLLNQKEPLAAFDAFLKQGKPTRQPRPQEVAA